MLRVYFSFLMVLGIISEQSEINLTTLKTLNSSPFGILNFQVGGNVNNMDKEYAKSLFGKGYSKLIDKLYNRLKPEQIT